MFTSGVEDRRVQRFLEKLKELYTFVEAFCKEQGLNYRYEGIEICEEKAGRYKTEELFVYKNDVFLFKLKPIGAYIIAADGRVDLIGRFDERKLIFLTYPRELVSKIEIDNVIVEERKTPLYKGFKEEGWYIVLERGKIKLLDKTSFCKALEEVSEFECSWKDKENIREF